MMPYANNVHKFITYTQSSGGIPSTWKKVETLSLNEIKHHRAIESKHATEDVAKNKKQKTLKLWKK